MGFAISHPLIPSRLSHNRQSGVSCLQVCQVGSAALPGGRGSPPVGGGAAPPAAEPFASGEEPGASSFVEMSREQRCFLTPSAKDMLLLTLEREGGRETPNGGLPYAPTHRGVAWPGAERDLWAWLTLPPTGRPSSANRGVSSLDVGEAQGLKMPISRSNTIQGRLRPSSRGWHSPSPGPTLARVRVPSQQRMTVHLQE